MKKVQLNDGEYAVIEGDTHISKWAVESGRLDHDQSALSRIIPFIPPGGVVVDAGAFIGDHTVAYAKRVGIEGEVHALEPNEEAYACLRFNTRDYRWVRTYCSGLSDGFGIASIARDQNAGASHLVEKAHDELPPPTDQKVIHLTSLDAWGLEQLNFLKLDIEGFEAKALMGAQETLYSCQPVMVIEVNDGALRRQGSSAEKLLALIDRLEYNYRNIYEGKACTGPQFDVICFHKSWK